MQITRLLPFDSAHRVLNHEGRCRYLHGHRYTAEVTVEAVGLDALGRVIDFGVLKSVLGGWIDGNLDHNAIFHPEDKIVGTWSVCRMLCGREPFIMPPEYPNPTAENIARLIYEVGVQLLVKHKICVVNVRVWETPNCYADYGRDDAEKQTSTRETSDKN